MNLNLLIVIDQIGYVVCYKLRQSHALLHFEAVLLSRERAASLCPARTQLDGIISRASGCRHRINTSVFNVSSVPRIGARSTGAPPKGRICPPHPNIISMEAVMDPKGVSTVCFIRKYEVRCYE